MLIIADHYKTKTFVSIDRYISVAILNNAFFPLVIPYGKLKCAFYIFKKLKNSTLDGRSDGERKSTVSTFESGRLLSTVTSALRLCVRFPKWMRMLIVVVQV